MATHPNLALLSYPVARDPLLVRRLRAFAIVTALLQAARVAYVLAGGSDRIVTSFPDDAFYYLRIAQNFAQLHRWTFDGSAPTTGFHLLWGYGWAAVFDLAPRIGLAAIYVLSFCVSEIFYILAALALGIVAIECYGSGALLAVCALFLGTSLFVLPTLGMESAPTLFFAAALCFLLFRPRRGESEQGARLRSAQRALLLSEPGSRLLSLYAVGLLGMLSRSDFGVFAFACLLACVVDEARRANLSLRAVRPALVAFAGALSGLAVVMAHCWRVSGHWLQASAATKYFWSSLNGHAVTAPLLLLASSIVYKLPFATILMYPVVLGVALLLFAGARHIWTTRAPVAPWLAGTLAVLGYIVLYSRDSRALQIWYAASFAAPLALICAPAAAAIAPRFRAWAVAATGAAVAGLFILSLLPLWASQKGLEDAGQLLAAQPQLAPVGAWNAGTLGFFAGRPVTNLDGLVNDDILPHAREGTLAQYVRERHIAYIVDYPAMLAGDLPLRGGYADGTLAVCLHPQLQIDAGKPSQLWQGTPLTLYQVDRACLQSHAKSAR